MPYKDPERKRQWEREHREQRNAMRRLRCLPAWSGHASVSNATSDIVAALRTRRKPAPDPASDQQPTSGWKVLLGFAVGVGVVVLGAMAGINVPPSDAIGGSGSGNPGM